MTAQHALTDNAVAVPRSRRSNHDRRQISTMEVLMGAPDAPVGRVVVLGFDGNRSFHIVGEPADDDCACAIENALTTGAVRRARQPGVSVDVVGSSMSHRATAMASATNANE